MKTVIAMIPITGHDDWLHLRLPQKAFGQLRPKTGKALSKARKPQITIGYKKQLTIQSVYMQELRKQHP